MKTVQQCRENISTYISYNYNFM